MILLIFLIIIFTVLRKKKKKKWIALCNFKKSFQSFNFTWDGMCNIWNIDNIYFFLIFLRFP